MKVSTNGHAKVRAFSFLIHDMADCLGGEPLQASLALLLKAHDYACDANRSVWDFAVEIQRLRTANLTECDLRWLCCKGHVEHVVEVTLPGQYGRSFGAVGCLKFFDESCFALTEEGVAFARQATRQTALAASSNFSRCNHHVPWRSKTSKHVTKPYWDAVERELRVGDALVKRFRVPAANQERVLTAFQEECWPKRIDDPLSQAPDIDPKRRLHSTIQCLNRNQKLHLVHFHGDGYGTAIGWGLVAQSNEIT